MLTATGLGILPREVIPSQLVPIRSISYNHKWIKSQMRDMRDIRHKSSLTSDI